MVTLIGSWEMYGAELILTQEAIAKQSGPTPSGPQPTATPIVIHLCRAVIDANTGEFFGLSQRATP
jgi:hypothetical protein